MDRVWNTNTSTLLNHPNLYLNYARLAYNNFVKIVCDANNAA
jgi:hypothetical protein